MKIYTKTGDEGLTGLFGGPRVSKDDPRICAYGSVDELNALLGVVRSQGLHPRNDEILRDVQISLFDIGAELASTDPERHSLKWDGTNATSKLEQAIDEADARLAPLKNFILPGGTLSASYLHLARTVCRRCEREIVSFKHNQLVSDLSQIIIYLNRLSDLLFVMSRAVNAQHGVADVAWTSSSRPPVN